MNVQSRPTQSTSHPQIGFLRPAHIERAFIWLLYAALALLVVLSILGTFYGRQDAQAPLAHPLQAWADIWNQPSVFGVACAIQGVLSLIQYGARQMTHRDRRWWILYLVALGVSVYYNVQAYWIPLTALLPFYLAGPLIVAGDVLPEYIAVRRN